MLSFASDYAEGAHEEILRRLVETNMEQLPGYGADVYCQRAADKIRAAAESPDAEVFFLAGGTQTNAVVIDAMLKRYEGVVSAATGHINVHEAGAIEAGGHKVLALPQHQGKLDARELEGYLRDFWADGTHSHMVFPGMVYISHPTEYGTLYSAKELGDISEVCRRYGIPLFLDGARLGYGLMSDETDVTLPMIAGLCDVFYIGGTKVGALCGEAVVFAPGRAPANFLTMVKQHGAMLAKGRLLGVQFDALFTDGLYERLGRRAIDAARRLKDGLRERGYAFLLDSPTNQQFVILDNEEMEALEKKVSFSVWEKVDAGRTAVRFATSWATTNGQVDELLGMLRSR